MIEAMLEIDWWATIAWVAFILSGATAVLVLVMLLRPIAKSKKKEKTVLDTHTEEIESLHAWVSTLVQKEEEFEHTVAGLEHRVSILETPYKLAIGDVVTSKNGTKWLVSWREYEFVDGKRKNTYRLYSKRRTVTKTEEELFPPRMYPTGV
jgi:hypothetical protein